MVWWMGAHRPGSRSRRWLVLGLLAVSPLARAEDFGPWSVDPRHPVVAPPTRAHRPPAFPPSASHPFTLAYRVWSELLTKIDGLRCAHRPSCGSFSHQAIQRFGLPLGVWMALDRLMRGARSSVLRTLPQLVAPGGVFFIDRLEDNLFWKPSYLPMSGR